MTVVHAWVRQAPVSWDPSAAHRFVTSDGTALRIECSGSTDADVTLVLVHGWTQDMRTWDPVLARLSPYLWQQRADRVRVLRYDHRGHGGSAKATPGTATVASAADDLAELLGRESTAGAGKVVLAGHSMGGMTVMELAKRHPGLVSERVAGAAFVATSATRLDTMTLGLPGAAGRGASSAERALFRRLAGRDAPLPPHPALLRPGVRWLVFGTHPSAADVAAVADAVIAAHPASLAWFRRSIAQHDCLGALGPLRAVPAVVMVGDADRLCPPRRAREIAAGLPDAEFVCFPGAGHMLTYERTDEVAARIRGLVERGLRRGSGHRG